MTKREEVFELLRNCHGPDGYGCISYNTAKRLAELLIPEEPKPTLRVTPCCVCGSLEQAWYITKGPDDPGKVYCATCPQGGMPLYPPAKPKPEPAKAAPFWIIKGATVEHEGTTWRLYPEDHISEREKRYREALAHITTSYYCTGETLAGIARKALEEQK